MVTFIILELERHITVFIIFYVSSFYLHGNVCFAVLFLPQFGNSFRRNRIPKTIVTAVSNRK